MQVYAFLELHLYTQAVVSDFNAEGCANFFRFLVRSVQTLRQVRDIRFRIFVDNAPRFEGREHYFNHRDTVVFAHTVIALIVARRAIEHEQFDFGIAQVIVTGVDKVIKNISSNDIDAYVDLKGLTEGEQTVKVVATGNDNRVTYKSKIKEIKLVIIKK